MILIKEKIYNFNIFSPYICMLINTWEKKKKKKKGRGKKIFILMIKQSNTSSFT